MPFIKTAVIESGTSADQLCLGILNFAYFLLVTITISTQSYEWFPQWICNIIEYIQPKFYLYNLKVKLSEQKSLVFTTLSRKYYFHQFMFFEMHVFTEITIVFFCYLFNMFKYLKKNVLTLYLTTCIRIRLGQTILFNDELAKIWLNFFRWHSTLQRHQAVG